jgi:hypothetical protein
MRFEGEKFRKKNNLDFIEAALPHYMPYINNRERQV